VTYSRFDDLALIRKLPETLQRCLALLVVERLAPWAALAPVTCREPPFDRLVGVPVFAGSMDAWASAVGAGAVRPGQAYDIAGTSEVVGLIIGERRTVPGLVSLLWGEAVHQIGGPTQAGADSARWCHDIFRLRGGLAAAIERAGGVVPSMELPLFLPYLAGERAPLWREDLRAAFHGVSRRHGPDDFLFAVLEGVAHAVRDIVAIAASGGEAPHELRVCGGGARSDAWCQLKADVTALPVMRAASRETGLVGCAIAAFIGLGRHPDLAAASDAMVPVERVFAPRPQFAALNEARAQSYRRAKEAALEMAAEMVA
jgi:xylulokinase